MNSTQDTTNDFLNVALLQMSCNEKDDTPNLKKGLRFCHQAAEMGADIALMPEMWNIGYDRFEGTEPEAVRAWQRRAIGRDSAFVKRYAELAKELNMAIAVTYLETWDGPPRNTMTLIDRHGQQVMTYAKVHSCDFATMEAATTPGDGFYVCDLDTVKGIVRIGAMICYDREHPESARCLMLEGAEIILTPNACILDDLRIDQFKTRAFENAVGVAMANYATPRLNGQSVAFDAGGHLIVHAGKAEGVYMAPFDLEGIREYRTKTIWGNAFRRPHRYAKLTDTAQEECFKRNNGFGQPFDAVRR